MTDDVKITLAGKKVAVELGAEVREFDGSSAQRLGAKLIEVGMQASNADAEDD